MASDELARLSRRVRTSPIMEDGFASMSSADYTERSAALPPSLRDDVNALMCDIREVIPSDFSFSVAFEFHGLRVSADLEDGNTAAFGGMGSAGFYTSRKSMLKKLRGTNWDEARKDAFGQMQAFDDMVNAAEDRPINIPSSAEAAARLSATLAPALESLRGRSPKFAVIGAQDGRIDAEVCDSDRNLIGTMGDMMACCYDILAVFREGSEMTFEQIEELKRTVAEGLGPISRAKAEGRFFA